MNNLTGRNIIKGDKEDYVSAVREFVEGLPSCINYSSNIGIGTGLATSLTSGTTPTPILPYLVLASRKKEIPIRILDRINDVVYYIDINDATEKVSIKGPEAIGNADDIVDDRDFMSAVIVKVTAMDSNDVMRLEASTKYFLKDKNDNIFTKLLPGIFVIEK